MEELWLHGARRQRGAFLPTSQRPKQIGKAIEIRHHGATGTSRSEAVALSAPSNGSGDIKKRTDAILTGNYEFGRWIELGTGGVDEIFEMGDHVVGDQRGARSEFVATSRIGSLLAHQNPKVALEMHQDVAEFGI